MASIAENICTVRNLIAKAESACDRSPNSVVLLAVSKTQTPEKLCEAYVAGQREFGENYVQEALEKMQALALPELIWHFIGPIQSNKTAEIASHFDWVHSVGRLKIAQRLSKQRPSDRPALNVCVQVNLSQEESKSGVALEEAAQLCEQIVALPGLCLRGLMAIPAPSTDYDAQRAVFRPLTTLFKHLSARFPTMDTLSIGMSDDYAAAIAEGATIVRIGSAIFGARS
jgi:pyridoxal phosphate enzyme (YggS family)